MTPKILEGVLIKFDEEDWKIEVLEGASILDEYFTDDDGGVPLTTPPVYVKNKTWKRVELTSDDKIRGDFVM
jgi:hypothetical protein